MGKIQADAADKECKGWLSMARNYIKAGMPEKAKPYLEQVIQKDPDTAYALEAKELLGEMGK
jgi:Tfp pilus assembly protein PilF